MRVATATAVIQEILQSDDRSGQSGQGSRRPVGVWHCPGSGPLPGTGWLQVAPVTGRHDHHTAAFTMPATRIRCWTTLAGRPARAESELAGAYPGSTRVRRPPRWGAPGGGSSDVDHGPRLRVTVLLPPLRLAPLRAKLRRPWRGRRARRPSPEPTPPLPLGDLGSGGGCRPDRG